MVESSSVSKNRFVQPLCNIWQEGVGAGAIAIFWNLPVGGIHPRQPVPGRQRLQHGAQRVVQRQHVMRAATCRQCCHYLRVTPVGQHQRRRIKFTDVQTLHGKRSMGLLVMRMKALGHRIRQRSRA